MPWSSKDVGRFKKGLTAKQKSQWVAIANASLQKCLDAGGTDETCAPKAIKIANGSVKESISMRIFERLKEVGKRNSATDQKAIQAIHDHASSMGAQCTPMEEALDFSHNDLMTILRNELREDINPNAYILDVFDTSIVYATGYEWSTGGSDCYQIDYTVAENGDVTWGQPVEVVRKVTYVPTINDEPTTESELITDSVNLVERAVSPEGTVMLKLISPGKGSTGYYSEDVLKRAAENKVFHKGLHNFIDHPTQQEEAQRPEGSIEKLGSALIEDAKWYDNWSDKKGVDHGPGLYASAKINPPFDRKLDVIADDIGISIRAKGRISKRGDSVHVESIDRAKSADYVTIAGRGGEVISLIESARQAPIGEQDMPITDEEIKRLQEGNRALADRVNRLQEGAALTQARSLVEKQLGEYRTLPRATRARLLERLPLDFTLDDNGALDVAKLSERIKQAVTDETSYLAGLGMGAVVNLGATQTVTESFDPEKMYDEFVKSLSVLDG
jgi:hypothetical protein